MELGGAADRYVGRAGDRIFWGSVNCDPFRAHSGTSGQETVPDDTILASAMEDGKLEEEVY